jgi:hypothetical protein
VCQLIFLLLFFNAFLLWAKFNHFCWGEGIIAFFSLIVVLSKNQTNEKSIHRDYRIFCQTYFGQCRLHSAVANHFANFDHLSKRCQKRMGKRWENGKYKSKYSPPSNVQQEQIEVSIEERRQPRTNITVPMPKMNGGGLCNGLLAIGMKEQKQPSNGINNRKEKVN